MSKNVYEKWVQECMHQGWIYGDKCDDVQIHPSCLVACGDLSEKEKVYDRNTSVETLKLFLKLGLVIEKE